MYGFFNNLTGNVFQQSAGTPQIQRVPTSDLTKPMPIETEYIKNDTKTVHSGDRKESRRRTVKRPTRERTPSLQYERPPESIIRHRRRSSSIKFNKVEEDSMYESPNEVSSALDAFFNNKITSPNRRKEEATPSNALPFKKPKQHNLIYSLTPPSSKPTTPAELKGYQYTPPSRRDSLKSLAEPIVGKHNDIINNLIPQTLSFASRYANGYLTNNTNEKVYIINNAEKIGTWKRQISKLKQKLVQLKVKKKKEEALKFTGHLSNLERQAFGHHLGVLYIAFEQSKQENSGPVRKPPQNKQLLQSPVSSQSSGTYYKDQVYQMNSKISTAFGKVDHLEDQLLQQKIMLKKMYSKIPREYRDGPFSVDEFQLAMNAYLDAQ